MKPLRRNLRSMFPNKKYHDFRQKGYDISGTISDAVKESDLVIDAAKDGFGYTNKVNFYIPMNKNAIFQGGEDRTGEKKVADIIHNSRINYDQAANQKYVIQGSCNVSGMGRIMQPMIEKFGDKIQRYDVTLIRRWADLEDTKDVKDSIEWDKNPHHQDDVKSFLPSVKLYVEAYKVPSRMMHLHQMTIRFKIRYPILIRYLTFIMTSLEWLFSVKQKVQQIFALKPVSLVLNMMIPIWSTFMRRQ